MAATAETTARTSREQGDGLGIQPGPIALLHEEPTNENGSEHFTHRIEEPHYVESLIYLVEYASLE
jgi:hypothetical protein